jgi:hypothetical protein
MVEGKLKHHEMNNRHEILRVKRNHHEMVMKIFREKNSLLHEVKNEDENVMVMKNENPNAIQKNRQLLWCTYIVLD